MADFNTMEFKAPGDLSKDKNMMRLGVIQRRLTREERIKQKEREEARKAGKLEPELDDDGKEINPQVPKFIADAPWYMADDSGKKSSLKHQRYSPQLQHYPHRLCNRMDFNRC
jgi:pre-mRNA-processing factor SLU7